RDAQPVYPAPAGHGRCGADGDEAIVPDRPPPGGGDGLWRRLLHADVVLLWPQPVGVAVEQAGGGNERGGALGLHLHVMRVLLQNRHDASISTASSLELGEDLHDHVLFADLLFADSLFADSAPASDAHAGRPLRLLRAFSDSIDRVSRPDPPTSR